MTNPLPMGPLHPSLLFWYLDRFCGRNDRTMFYDRDGQPDLHAARNFAEALRTRLALSFAEWDQFFHVTQRNHEVFVRSELGMPDQATLAWYRQTRHLLEQAQGAGSAPEAETGRREGRRTTATSR